MRKLILAIVLTVLFANPVFADYMNSKGGGGGSSTNTNIFFGVNQSPATGLNYIFDTSVSPDGIYVYNVGRLASNNHAAVNKMKISDGSVVATLDLGVAVNNAETCELDSAGTNLYVVNDVSYWKIDASALTVTHTAALTGGVAAGVKRWDLSPNGASLVYANADIDQTIHFINTTTYAVTNRTLGHSAGGANTYSVCFLDDTHVYASYTATATIDQYTTAGVWVLAVNTTDAAGIGEMRAGLHGYLFLLGLTQLESVDPSHVVTTYPYIPEPSSLSVDKGAAALSAGNDLALVIGRGEDGGYILDGQYVGPSPISFPAQAMWEGVGRVGMAQDNSGLGFIGSESTVPMLVSLNSDFVDFAANGDNTDITSLKTTKANTMTAATDITPLTIHGFGAGQTANILTIDNMPFGASFSIGPYGNITTTYDILAGRTLAANTALSIGSAGAYMAVDSTAVATNLPLILNTAGTTISIKTGANAKAGTYTIGGGGTVTIATTAVTANSVIFYAPDSSAAIVPYTSATTPATDFTITGTIGSTGHWWIVEMP